MAMQQADPQLVAKAADFIRRREKTKAELVQELTLLQERIAFLEQSRTASEPDPSIFDSDEERSSLDIGGSVSLEETILQLQGRNRELEQLTRELEEKLENALEAANRCDSRNEDHSAEADEWRRRSDDLQEENLRIKKELVDLQDAHEELAEAMRSLQKRVDASPALLWAFSPDLQSVEFNQTFFDLVGKSADEGPKGWQDYLHPEDLDAFNETVRRAAGNREPYSLEHRLLCGDGSYRWFWSVGTPCFDELSGERGGRHVGVSMDISLQREAARRLAEDERRRKDQITQCWLARETELVDLHEELQETLARPLTAASEQLEEVTRQLAELKELWRKADKARTRLATGPALLRQEGLERAISELARLAGICRGVEVQCDARRALPRLNPESELLIFAVLRDLLKRLSSTGEASALHVVLDSEDGQLRIRLEGREVSLEAESGESARRLLETLSGHLTMETAEGGEVLIDLTVPVSF